jgi:hypothetical protein
MEMAAVCGPLRCHDCVADDRDNSCLAWLDVVNVSLPVVRGEGYSILR